MMNPLLEEHELPPFSRIDAEQGRSGLLTSCLSDYRTGVESLLANDMTPDSGLIAAATGYTG